MSDEYYSPKEVEIEITPDGERQAWVPVKYEIIDGEEWIVTSKTNRKLWKKQKLLTPS